MNRTDPILPHPNTWSATRKLLATTLPSSPQGVPVVTNIYDPRDWLSRTLNPLQQPTVYTNDVAGRLLSVTDPLLRTANFGYDADGRKTTATNAAQEVTSQQWSPRGELTKLIDPATNIVCRVSVVKLPNETIAKHIRVLLLIFIAGLVVSGATAIPLETELNFLTRTIGASASADLQQSGLSRWLGHIRAALVETNAKYPFMAY